MSVDGQGAVAAAAPGGEDGDDESVPLPSATGDQPDVSAATDLKRRRVATTKDSSCKAEPAGLVYLLGRAIRHKIAGYVWHDGRVRSRADDKAKERYVVVYDDGDEVTLTRAQVEKYSVVETSMKEEIFRSLEVPPCTAGRGDAIGKVDRAFTRGPRGGAAAQTRPCVDRGFATN